MREDPLNRFLIRYALQNQQSGASQTYVALSGDELIGYYTLVFGQVEHVDAPERLTKGLARHPVPIMLLARLVIAQSWQGRGVGSGLLKDAMFRTLQAADIAGIRAFAAHASDDEARAFMSGSTSSPHPSIPITCSSRSRMSVLLCSPGNSAPTITEQYRQREVSGSAAGSH